MNIERKGIWHRIWGGWRTHGPNSGTGVYISGAPDSDPAVTQDTAVRLSAYLACLSIRGETIGTLPCHLRDKDKKILTDHELYTVLHESPNAMDTAAEYWQRVSTHVDSHGNHISIKKTRSRDRSLISLEPVFDPTAVAMGQEKSGAVYYEIGGEKFAAEDIFHVRGFSLGGWWGLSRLEAGCQILNAQMSANSMAATAFKQGIKVGGFFIPESNLSTEQHTEFTKRINEFSETKNAGRWLTLPKGIKPEGGSNYRAKSSEAELLTSRFFGIEEICRLLQTPPQLIGHTDKASSWASSAEQINLQFLMYGLTPTLVRCEQRIFKSLMTPADRARRYQAKFSIQGLLRSDLKTRQAFYASALQNGYFNRDEVRDFEERATIPGGDKYTVQANMVNVDELPTNEPGATP